MNLGTSSVLMESKKEDLSEAKNVASTSFRGGQATSSSSCCLRAKYLKESAPPMAAAFLLGPDLVAFHENAGCTEIH